MDDVSERYKKLGASVSDTAERLIDPGELAAARRLLMETPAARARPARRRAAIVAALSFAAILALIFVKRYALSPAQSADRVTFAVGSRAAPGTVGEWVAADRDARLPVRFSEGTSFVLAPGATARVTEVTSHGATLLLERGEVAAVVVHADARTQWNLHAGPFQVRITGTAFDASWDPAGETFELTMRQGTVVVSGPLLRGGHELGAGERLRVSVRDGSMELHTASVTMGPQAAPNPGPAEPGPGTKGPQPSSIPEPAASSAPHAAEPTPSTSAKAADSAAVNDEHAWRALAAAGKYGEALAAAERAGFSQVLEHASAADLATLVDAARYGARPGLAKQALLAQRRRFGARGSSAFLLGKIAADQQGAPADAVHWFEVYLQEEPHGALAEQALGRILQLEKENPASARRAAERYLARYPNGVHAALAKSLLTPRPSL